MQDRAAVAGLAGRVTVRTVTLYQESYATHGSLPVRVAGFEPATPT